MTDDPQQPDDLCTALASLPHPAELSGQHRTRLESYLAALDTARHTPTAATLQAAAVAAFELHSGYVFYGWTRYGDSIDERGLILMRQATALQDAASHAEV